MDFISNVLNLPLKVTLYFIPSICLPRLNAALKFHQTQPAPNPMYGRLYAKASPRHSAGTKQNPVLPAATLRWDKT
jgi:hypothetical protein